MNMHSTTALMNKPAFWLTMTAMLASLSASVLAQPIVVRSGDSIAFMGDSITAEGWKNPAGYVRLVMKALAANGIEATAIPAGVSGHKSNNMLERLQRDVLNKKPIWMTLSCGVNDVWHGAKGVALPQYKTNITEIISKCHAAGIRVMILTATVIGEQENQNNTKLADYNDFLRSIAKEKQCLLADLNADMWAGLKAAPGKQNVFTRDGVHMGPKGNYLMAAGILRAFGLTEHQISNALAVGSPLKAASALAAQTITNLGAIMPLGDSTTTGNTAGGYRDPLYTLLNNAGYTFKFVGSRTENPTEALTAAGQDHHEGHRNTGGAMGPSGMVGMRWIGEHLGEFLSNNPPDRILLAIGANDMRGSSTESQFKLMSKLVADIFAMRPTVKLYVASVPRQAPGPVVYIIESFNKRVAEIVAANRAQGRNVVFVSMDAIQPSDPADYMHPGKRVCQKMAQTWYDALVIP